MPAHLRCQLEHRASSSTSTVPARAESGETCCRRIDRQRELRRDRDEQLSSIPGGISNASTANTSPREGSGTQGVEDEAQPGIGRRKGSARMGSSGSSEPRKAHRRGRGTGTTSAKGEETVEIWKRT